MRITYLTRHVCAAFLATAVTAACSSSEPPPTGGGTPVVASVTVTPGTFSVATNASQQFGAQAYDSNNAPMSATFTWGATGGTVSGSGLFTGGAAAGAATVWAVTGTKSDTAEGAVTSVGGGGQVDTVFSEGFESNSFAAWDDRGRTQEQTIVTTQAHTGTRSLQVNFPMGSDGGWLTKFFMPGYDSIYVSYWVRFQPTWIGATKLLAVYGSRTDNQWSATGQAGVCPTGTDFFGLDVVMDFQTTPSDTRFYSYYPGMAQTPPGSGTCYGSYGIGIGAVYTPPLTLSTGTWHHIEFWIKLNTPGQSNLVQHYCVNGVMRGSWSGISVRSSNILMLNAVTLSNSIALGSPQTQLMWADDLLVTRQRPPGAC